MKKKGFIATSLIYSFFLAFIAVMAAFLSNYIAGKRIVENFNSKVADELSKGVYSVTIYSKNANILNGMSMTNLLAEGQFTDYFKTFWTTSGSAIFSSVFMGETTLLRSGGSSYLYQNVYLNKNDKYYFKLDYSQSGSALLYNSFEGTTARVQTQRTGTGKWMSGSAIFTAPQNGSKKFILGQCVSNCSSSVYFKNAMVVDLTASFGAGYEPDKEWLDKNINWFDGTINYIKTKDIKYGDAAEFHFQPYSGYNNDSIICTSDSDEPVYDYTLKNKIIDGTAYKTLKLSSVKSNIVCHVNWRT